MRPESTTYRMATPDDMIRIYENFDLTRRLGWPTVIAERDKEIIGFLGTQDRQDMVVAGPLEIKLKNKAFVMFRLIDSYDEYMRRLGMKIYWASVEDKNKRWLDQMRRFGTYEEIDKTDNLTWFRRNLTR